MDLNGLHANMITAQESLILNIIDSIPNKGRQRELIEKVLEANKPKKLDPKLEAIVNPTCSINKVLNGMKVEKPLSINDLKAEINSLKSKIVQLHRRIEILELDNNKNENESDFKLFEESNFDVG